MFTIGGDLRFVRVAPHASLHQAALRPQHRLRCERCATQRMPFAFGQSHEVNWA